MQYFPFNIFKKPKNYNNSDFVVPSVNSQGTISEDNKHDIEYSSDILPSNIKHSTPTTTTISNSTPYHNFIEITKTVKSSNDQQQQQQQQQSSNDNNSKKRKYEESNNCSVVIENVNIGSGSSSIIENDDTETVIEEYDMKGSSPLLRSTLVKHQVVEQVEEEEEQEQVEEVLALPNNPIHLENFIINNLPLKEISNKLKMGKLGEKLIREFSRFYTILILNNNEFHKFQSSPLVQLFWIFGLNDILINNQFKSFNKLYKLNDYSIELIDNSNNEPEPEPEQSNQSIRLQRKRYKRTLKYYNKYFTTPYDSVKVFNINIWPDDYLRQQEIIKKQEEEEEMCLYEEEEEDDTVIEEVKKKKKKKKVESDDDYVDDEDDEEEEEEGEEEEDDFDNEKELKNQYNVKKESTKSLIIKTPITRSQVNSVSLSTSPIHSTTITTSSPTPIISRSRVSLASLSESALSESSTSSLIPILKRLKKPKFIKEEEEEEEEGEEGEEEEYTPFGIGCNVEARCNANGMPYDNTFFEGKVLSYNKRTGKYLIQYDTDGTEEYVDKKGVKKTSDIEVTLDNFKKGKKVIFKKDNNYWYGPATLLSIQHQKKQQPSSSIDNTTNLLLHDNDTYKIEYLNDIYNLKFNPKTPICYFY